MTRQGSDDDMDLKREYACQESHQHVNFNSIEKIRRETMIMIALSNGEETDEMKTKKNMRGSTATD